MSIMFNEICINDEMLPIYIYIYIYTSIYIYIYMMMMMMMIFRQKSNRLFVWVLWRIKPLLVI